MSEEDYDIIEDLMNELDEETNQEYLPRIILKNDDYNTFEHVEQCLIEYCKHTPQQAHQCAILVHFKGECQVKTGEFKNLIPIKDALCDNGLDAIIVKV